MAVTLRVSSFQSHSLGPNATRVFDSAGTIGRSPGNDWVLPDPERFVSGQHAAISYDGGVYFLTDLSTNGTIVNGELLPKGARVRLQNGDRLTVGNYEIGVFLDTAPALHGAAPLHRGAPDRGFDPRPMAGRESSVDPLDFFAAPAVPGHSVPAGAEPDHAPAPSAFFAPPQVRPDPLLGAARPAPSPPASGGAAPIPENWDDTGFTAAVPAPVFPEPEMRSAAPAPSFHEPESPTLPPPGPSSAAPRPAPQQSAAPATLASGAAPASAPSDLDALLRAAGLDPATVDSGTLASLGEILKVVVDGLLEVLRARAAIKNQFRVAMTTLKPVENNPLKFSASADDALFNLFGRRGQSYLAPVDAFREAFDDLKAHQLAMMAGMRAAFDAVLARFDPDELQEGFDKGLKRSALLDVMNKTKYWDLYREMYAELGDDDATFRRLFGDEFAQAYEVQMQRLAAQARQRQ